MNFIKAATKFFSKKTPDKVKFSEVTLKMKGRIKKLVPPKFKKEGIFFYSIDKNKVNLFNLNKEYVYTVNKEDLFESVDYGFSRKGLLIECSPDKAEYYSKKISNLI